MRVLRRLLLPALLLLAAAPARAQETPPGYEAGLYELAIEGLAPVPLPALLSPTAKVLVPVRPVLEVAGAPFRVLPDSGFVSVARPRGAGTATLSLPARTLRAAREVALAEDDALAWRGELYLATGTLGELLEAEVALRPDELAILLSRDPPFPAQERLAVRERRERELATGTGAARAEAARVPFLPRTGGGVLEWGAASAYPEPHRPTSLFARAGFSLLGGMARLGATAADPDGAGLGLDAVEAAWHRVFPNGNLVRQVLLGDVVTEGLRARSIRGVVVSNAPFSRDPLFGEAVFRPALPSGWEYEIYQEGRLLGFSDAASGTPVSIPLRYGSTPVQLRLLGPAGERITSELVYLVPVLQLPRGRWQYSAGAGACPGGETCDAYGYADLRHGLSSWVTLFGGVDVTADSLGREVRPYGGASIVPARAWVVEVQGMHRSFLQATVQSFGAGRVTGAAGAGITWPGRENVSVVGAGGFPLIPAARRSWHADAALRMRLGSGTALVRSLDLSGRVDGNLDDGEEEGEEADGESGAGGGRTQLTAAASLRRVLAEATYERTGLGGSLFLGRVTLPLLELPGWLRASTLSAAAGYGAEGVQRWEGTLTTQPPGAIVTATARWNRGLGPVLLVGSTFRPGFGRAQARVVAQRGQPAQGAVSVDGAATFGGGAGGGAGGGGGGGGLRVRTDSAGRYRTWGVLPYEVLAVSLDTTTVADPAWVPARPGALLRPSPHLYTPVDFPLVRTRELIGRLVPAAGVPTAGAVTVEITDTATGETQRTVTFSDGEFYVGRMRPGTYELRVSASSLGALGARAEPGVVRVTIPAAGEEPLVEVPPVRLVQARP